jgi:hypothetical protein
MKIIISENQLGLIRRIGEIERLIDPTMDMVYEYLQGSDSSPLKRKLYNPFESTVVMKLANELANKTSLIGDEKVTLRNQLQRYITNHYYEKIRDYFMSRLEGNINENYSNDLDNNKPIEMLTKIKSDIDNLLSYYVKNEDGTYSDKSTNQSVNLKPIGGFYKVQIESILFGSKIEGQPENVLSQLESIKNEIINGKLKEFFGDYELITISKQKFDYYTKLKCDIMKPKSPGCQVK